MRQRLDLPDLYAQATDVVGDGARSAVPAAGPFTLDELLSPRPDLDVLLARLAHPTS